MSAKCKLCTRQLVDEDIELIPGHENRVELLEYIFAKFNLQYDDKDILCVACQKNLKAVKLVMSRWQEAQKQQCATNTVSTIVKAPTTSTPVASTKQQTTLLKKPTAAASISPSSSKDQVQPNKKQIEIIKIQDIRQLKSPIPKKGANTSPAADAVRLTASRIATKVKTNVRKPTTTEEECEEKTILSLIESEDEEISPRKAPLTRSILKKQHTQNVEDQKPTKTIEQKQTKTIEQKQTKTIEQKQTKPIQQQPFRKIHNIGFEEKEVPELEDDNDDDDYEALLKQSSPKKAKNKKNNSAEDLEAEYEEEVKENENESETYSDAEQETVEPVDINDVGSMLQIGLIRSANGETVAQIFEENKTSIQESDSLQSCIICELCQDVLTSIRDFHKHLKDHTKRAYECKDCLQTFNTLTLLQKHQKSAEHVGIKTKTAEDDRKMIFFECVSCEKVFLELYNMSRHNRDVHRAPKDRYKCTQCGSCFKYKISLTEHLAKHMKININSIKCPHCERMFKNNYQLNRHMRIHTGEKPYECETCKKKFRHSANLNVHKRTHTGELPFTCKLCGKGFSTSTHMRRHLKSCERRFNGLSKRMPTLVTLKEEDLRYEPQKSTKSEVVFTLNTERIINSNQSDSLLKRSVGTPGASGATKRKAAEISTPSPKKEQKTQQIQKKEKPQSESEQQKKQNIQVVLIKKCNVCNKVFKDQEAFKVHMATHEKAVTLRCPQCPKRFSDPYLFKRHKLEHNLKTSTLSLQKATKTTTITHDDDDDEDENVTFQEVDDEDDTFLLDFQIDKLEPASPSMHDDGVDTSTLNNFRIVSIDNM